jgi:spermidine/putrescine transport system substrate-binding protein
VERALGLGLTTSAVGGLLAACGGEPAPTASPLPPLDTALPTELHLLNWMDYMAPGVKRGFYEKHGVKVVETYFDDSESPLEKMTNPAAPAEYDIFILSDYVVQVVLGGSARNMRLQPLHMDRIPNFKNVMPQLADPAYDQWPDGAKYSVPYQWGTTGIAARTDKAGEPITRWAQLFPPEGAPYKGRIQMLNDERESPAAALLKNGFSINTTSQAELDQATNDLIAQKPLVRAYDSVNQKRAMVEGVPLVHCWNGDVLMAWDAGVPRQKLEFVHPQEGFPVWTDTMCIPAGAPSPYAAHLFIDYVCDPQVNAKLTNWTWYSSPIVEAAQYIDEKILSVMPTDEELERGELYQSVDAFSHAYTDAWAKVKSS